MTVGSILSGLWRFVRANSKTIAGWWLLYIAWTVLLRLGLQPFYQAQFAAAAAIAQGLPAATPPIGQFIIVWLLSILGFLVLIAALWRALLFPAERRLLYLRIGADEGRLLGLVAALVVAGLLVVVAIAVGGVVIGLVVALGAGGNRGVGVAMGLLLVLAIWVAGTWLAVRLSLVGPLTLTRRRIAIREGWELASGRFWTLFGAYLLIWLAAMVAILIVSLPRILPFLALARQVGDPRSMQIEMMRLQADQMAIGTDPAAILTLLLASVVGIVVHIFLAGGPAVAVAQLLALRGEARP